MANHVEFLGASHAATFSELMSNPDVMDKLKDLLHAREALIGQVMQVAESKNLPLEHVTTAEDGSFLKDLLDKIEQSNRETGTPLVDHAVLVSLLKNKFDLDRVSGIKPR